MMDYWPLVLFVGCLVVFVLLYNSLISKKNAVDDALGGISAYLKKRADLIPNLVATVQEYAVFEKNLLNDVTKLRSWSQRGFRGEKELAQADSIMGKIVGNFVAVAENYPDLKASANFVNLQHSLNEIEEQLSAARRTYNAAVVSYNNAIQMIPANFVASVLGYKSKSVFLATENESKLPQVQELFQNQRRDK